MKMKKSYAIITAAVVLAGSIFAVNEYNSTKIKAPELTTCVDNEDGINVAIDENEVPLGNTKVSTKTSTKKSKKTVTLKKASKKTYSKTKNSAKTATKTTKSSSQTVKVVTKTNTSVLENYKKKSKKKTVTTTVKTTVTTTTVTASSVSTSGSTATGVSTAKAATNGTASINSVAPKAESNVLSAYNQLGFTVKFNSGVNYSGMFDARSQSITMKTNNSVIYHELGHFVAFAAGNVDKQSEFAGVYSAEKGKYKESDKAYITSSASEYFAQSYKNYVESPGTLKSERPQTYAFIQKSVAAITSAQVEYIQSVYGAYWASRN